MVSRRQMARLRLAQRPLPAPGLDGRAHRRGARGDRGHDPRPARDRPAADDAGGPRGRAAAHLPADAARSPTSTRTPGAASTSPPPPRSRWPTCSATCWGSTAGSARGRRSSTAASPAATTARSPTARARRSASASWPTRRASTSPPRTRTPTRSPTCRCCGAVGHPVAVNPDSELARIAAEEGWDVLRFEQLGRRMLAAGALVGHGRRRDGRARRRRAAGDRSASGGAAGPGRAPARMSLHDLTDEQRDIRDLARRFADEVVAPQAAAWDREHRFPKEVAHPARRARPARRDDPAGARRRGCGLRLLRAGDGGALARRRGAGDDLRRARERGDDADRRARVVRAGASDSCRRWRRGTSSGRSR